MEVLSNVAVVLTRRVSTACAQVRLGQVRVWKVRAWAVWEVRA